ncbi:hypothetical protein FA95DRAFT_1574307 [Auriscalpium vulgare]|uniref:Uncharacterized protein n=1 Tax=Auriscalpium vulgare TaxID=40419 RepID=A0ACB8RL42_9AGAM|nr:hypothetical protein FA95DRAFT_1574307 [Auriscalpium vulgare]
MPKVPSNADASLALDTQPTPDHHPVLPSNPSAQLRAERTCAPCRTRKIKCDKVLPCCGPCSRIRRSHCSYPSRRKLPERPRRRIPPLYRCRVIRSWTQPGDSSADDAPWYLSLPFFSLVVGTRYEIVQDAGWHRVPLVGLSEKWHEGRLLVARDEDDEVGWLFATHVEQWELDTARWRDEGTARMLFDPMDVEIGDSLPPPPPAGDIPYTSLWQTIGSSSSSSSSGKKSTNSASSRKSRMNMRHTPSPSWSSEPEAVDTFHEHRVGSDASPSPARKRTKKNRGSALGRMVRAAMGSSPPEETGAVDKDDRIAAFLEYQQGQYSPPARQTSSSTSLKDVFI